MDEVDKALIRRAKAKNGKLEQEKHTLNIGIYRRVSTREQAEEGQSLHAQLAKLKSYIEFNFDFFSSQVF